MATDPGRELGMCLMLAPAGVVPAAPAIAQTSLPAAERAAAFSAGGFTLKDRMWRGCGDPGTPAYSPGTLDMVRDLNGDGRPEALIVEESTYCLGATETGYVLVSKQADGSWRRITGGPGVPTF